MVPRRGVGHVGRAARERGPRCRPGGCRLSVNSPAGGRCDTRRMSLISTAQLAGALDDPDLRIADVRWSLAEPTGGRSAYATAHLPGAIFADLESILTAPPGAGRHPLPDPAAFAAALATLGIGRGHRVVAYDDSGGTVAARLWWMLDALGHAEAAVLDGGIGAWQAAGLPVTTEVPAFAAAEPIPTGVGSAWPQTIDRVALAARLGGVTILDARARERYRGDVEPIDRIPGHIPTARSLPTTALLAGDERFLEPAALAARFEGVGVGATRTGEARPDGPAVVSCGSGVNACHLALGMRAAGLPDPLLYPGSYSDWTRAGMPIATGDAPGELPRSSV
jgi:thiosulfate/3-mercaptopyruvate sulfurtransferase